MGSEREIAASIRDKFVRKDDQLPPSSQCRRCIFRVPHMLRRHNEKAFMPKVVSIGPFHHGNTQLQAMENIKLLYLEHLVLGTGFDILESLVKAIQSIEWECRHCYEDPVVDQIRFNEFIEMMVIDGHFILEFLCRYLEKRKRIRVLDTDDQVFKTSWMPRKIVADLLLLENQLPWCVIDCLYNVMISTGLDRFCTVASLVAVPFSEYRMFKMGNQISPARTYKHLLDFFRAELVGSCRTEWRAPLCADCCKSCEEALVWKPIPSVTELLDFEVSFFPAPDQDEVSILDVKFEDGKMKIPKIFIDENTESLFRNLIALEHCDPSMGTQVTSYAAILGCLVKSPADALHLKQKYILHIGSSVHEDPAISFLHSLRNDTSFHGPLYLELCRDVNTFQSEPFRRYKATLRRDYNLKDPTTFLTVVYGIAFSLFLGILQTIFAILSYFK
ncbi:UPF0481 protein At3g47200-like [Carya illinoinensis]|uniref:Uncharacterized protein n=1 Tax=Carya illinoinensis TaxID=32201 RepID=A0A8T1NWL9_CARIL|nr:UPF0481 protein At3g47200-like [Carya illinoinensis]XP_042953631.1 UPF0481 protein At3g47200-like [Carya illinoinensis]KAG6633323.1 hypothetical protein CIPAW_12G041200 [Carya illinoinensis]KAG6633324.1 hypothetical protein CIPAW_12G041200 [Carya illinoinensis]